VVRLDGANDPVAGAGHMGFAPAARHGAAAGNIIAASPGHVAGLARIIKGSNGGFVDLIGSHVTATSIAAACAGRGSILSSLVQLGSCVCVDDRASG
jgi:hypothetical protein